MLSAHIAVATILSHLIVICTTLHTSAAVTYIGDDNTYSDTWAATLYGSDADPSGDHGTGQSGSDLVGSISVPFFYTLYDDSSDDSLDNGTLSFRARLAEDNGKGAFAKNLIVGIDVDGDLIFDAFAGVDKKNNVFLYQADGDNNSVNTLGWDSGTDFNTLGSSNNYDFREIENQDVSNLDHQTLDLDGGDTNDYLLSFSINLQDLYTATGVDIGLNNEFRYIVGTSTNLNNFTQDIGGINDSGDNADLIKETPFVDLIPGSENFPDELIPDEGEPPFVGGVSGGITPEGIPTDMIPEPSSSMLLLIGLLGLCGMRRRV